MQRYICPKCLTKGAHPKHMKAPLCHKCDHKVTMIKNIGATEPILKELRNKLSDVKQELMKVIEAVDRNSKHTTKEELFKIYKEL